MTNDTGPAHIAYALGCPAVTVFGGGDLERYRAFTTGHLQMLAHPVGCRPCSYAEFLIGYVCLENVGVETLVMAAEKLLM